MSKNKLSANELYAKMLEYGSEHLEDGISLDEIRQKFKEEGFIKNNNSDDYLAYWFDYSFEHKEEGCKCKFRPDNECGCDKDDPCYDYDHSSNCKHYISKDACIDYLHLSESEKNLKSVKISRQISFIALLISDGILLLNFLSNHNKKSFADSIEFNEIRQEIIDLKTNGKSSANHLNQLDTTVLYFMPLIKEYHEENNEILQEISKSLKNINYNIRKLRVKENGR